MSLSEPPGSRHKPQQLTFISELFPDLVASAIASREEDNASASTADERWVSGQPPKQISKAPSRRHLFRKKLFPTSSIVEWNDWRWQLQNRITTFAQISRIIKLSETETAALTAANGRLPFAITPYYASLIDEFDPEQPLRRTVIPVERECIRTMGEEDDPLGEDGHSVVPGLVHRYPDRVLFLVTGYCSTNCRYCTRSRIVGGHDINTNFSMAQWEQAIRYIEANPQIRDVLLSGGDPLTIPEEKLEWLLSRLRQIRHVEMLRIGTKVPMVLPQRVTPSLVKMLRRFHPLFISIHATHPDELTAEAFSACTRLADAGIPLGSQTVLLAGINDSVSTMTELVHGLLKMRVRPYYLYQCDPITGSAHFRTPVEKGLEIIRGLRGHTSGYAVPTYVIDAPKGGGKIPLLPEYVVGRDGNDLLLTNYQNNCFRYPDRT
jgi:lysine 2,3-aminomutase